jgi:hypothetical protein
MDWARVLAYVTGTVDQELLARNEYLRRKQHPEGPVESAAEPLGHRASHGLIADVYPKLANAPAILS